MAGGLQNSAWLAAPAVLFLLLFFVVPLGRMVELSLFDPDFTLAHYREFFDLPAYPRIAINTFGLAAGVASICLVLGYPVAYALTSASPQMRRLLLVPIMLPYLTSLMVRTYAWVVLLGREGVVNKLLDLVGIGKLGLTNNTFGVYVGMVHVLLPLMILPLLNVMGTIDGRVLRAALGLGATPWQSFWRVFVPLSLPGIVAGFSLVFIVALGFFVTPALLGGLADTTVSMLIENQVGVALNWGLAAALGVILLLATIVVLAMAMLLVSVVNRTIGVAPLRLLGSKA
ncbi:MAG TPA: ABC transporter permease [Stellaceae bacterium]|jgi:putative spermidine/putrescine transport system permease protein|nr:ABC transporter permease [Stellaceae bacterium]